MLRAVLAVIVGYVVWTALWLGGSVFLFGEAAKVMKAGERYTAAGPLIGMIGLSVVCSLVAGFAGATIGKDRARPVVLAMAGFLLLTGIAVQSGVWKLLPVWYHLTFLGLLVPATILGGRLARRGTSS